MKVCWKNYLSLLHRLPSLIQRPPTLASSGGDGIVGGMKQILLMITVVALVGCSSPQGINQNSKFKIGTPILQFETGSYVSSPAIGSDGGVYVGSHDNKLYAINGKSGVRGKLYSD